MGQVNSTTRTYLRESERYKIEAFRQKKLTGREIGRLLGRNHRTINREIKRGTIELLNSDLTTRKVYKAHIGQEIHDEKSKHKGPGLKIGSDHKLAEYIELTIKKDRFSPAAVAATIKNKEQKFTVTLSAKTIYNYIGKEVFYGISNEDLWMKRKRKNKNKRVRVFDKNRLCKSIEDRPKEANERSEYGHWEIDCVKGKQGDKECLLTLSERKTRKEIIEKMKSASNEEVDKVLTKLEQKYKENFKDIFKSITADNGSEFLNWEFLEASKVFNGQKRTNIYFAHPYCSCERGTNENSNRMIRRFIPKGTSIGPISNKEIKKIETWMNNYPRKVIGYETATQMTNQIFTRKMPQLVGVGF